MVPSKVGKEVVWTSRDETSWFGVARLGHLVRRPWDLVQPLGKQYLPGGEARKEILERTQVEELNYCSSTLRSYHMHRGPSLSFPSSDRDTNIPSAYTDVFD